MIGHDGSTVATPKRSSSNEEEIPKQSFSILTPFYFFIA